MWFLISSVCGVVMVEADLFFLASLPGFSNKRDGVRLHIGSSDFGCHFEFHPLLGQNLLELRAAIQTTLTRLNVCSNVRIVA